MWFMEGMCYLPTALVIWSSAAFIISYVIAVLTRDVEPFFPYISDTGTTPPESGVFGLMVFISAALGAATMYTKYKLLEKQNEPAQLISSKFNIFALIVGLFGCLGMAIVAAFQETAVPKVHDIGALMAFFCGVLHIFLQSIISYKMHVNRALSHTRMAISFIAVIAFIIMLVCAGCSKLEIRVHWVITDKNYVIHAVSAVCEWLVAFSFVFFFFTYIREFQTFRLTVLTEIYDELINQYI
ncbi:DNA damage-regulated autophagy modulator protein 1 [Protopterus annectens]|uniref:DNA damage-regulated autophagy modulator protein 1 n=1 Tax=Protopterus annectens TaxID=7888 RepID=UPI001CFA1B00|nr:DNA damage-regulated autophagy modulator protein 1 [Protopterus annectens]